MRAEAVSQIHDRQSTQVEETNHMKNRNIIMTAADHAELEKVITFTGKVSERARAELYALEGELRRAEIVTAEAITLDVITYEQPGRVGRSRDYRGHAIHSSFAT